MLSTNSFIASKKAHKALIHFNDPTTMVTWNSMLRPIRDAEIHVDNLMDYLFVEGSEGQFILKKDGRFYLNTRNYGKTYPKAKELGKREKSFYLGKSELGEDLFLIVTGGDGNHNMDEHQESTLSVFEKELEYLDVGLQNALEEGVNVEDDKQQKGKQVGKELSSKIYLEILKCLHDDPVLSKSTGVFSKRNMMNALKKFKREGGFSLNVTEYLLANLIRKIKVAVNLETIKMVAIQFGQNISMNGREEQVLLKYLGPYELRKCDKFQIAATRDMCGPEGKMILAKKDLLPFFMARGGEELQSDPDFEGENC